MMLCFITVLGPVHCPLRAKIEMNCPPRYRGQHGIIGKGGSYQFSALPITLVKYQTVEDTPNDHKNYQHVVSGGNDC